MKKLLPYLTIALLISCSSDSDESSPELSFAINDGLRFASAEVSITNTSTNYSGTFSWEVTSQYESLLFSTNDIVFNPKYSGQYIITLKTADGNLETNNSIFISRPNKKIIKEVGLASIPKSYDELYFNIVKYTLAEDNTLFYTSSRISDVTSENLANIRWTIDETDGSFELSSISNDSSDEFASYTIEFYDGNDNFVTRLESIFNSGSDGIPFEAGEINLATTPSNCGSCDQFETRVDIDFSN